MSVPLNEMSERLQRDSLMNDSWMRWLLSLPCLWLGTLLAGISVAEGMRNALLRSLDFQWSPARLLTEHVDPWATYLNGDAGHRILLNQIPNYLHELYVAMLPFGYMSAMPAKLLWAICNFALVIGSCICVARLYELDGRRGWLFAVLVFTSTPFRVTLGNGQVTALVLFCLSLWAFAFSSTARGCLLGVAWAKYSVPPVMAVFLLLRRRWKLLFVSLIPPAAGFLFIYFWLRTPFMQLLVEPFRCSTDNVSPGLANVMAVSEITLRRPHLFQPVPDALYLSSQGWVEALPYLIAVIFAVGIAVWLFRRADGIDGRIPLACLTAASLLCFKHQIYDFLLLIFCLAIALKAPRSFARNWLLILIGYFWYAERLVHIRRWEFWPATVIVSFFILLGLIAASWKLRSNTRWKKAFEL